jgi:hypothetical protein
MPRLTRAAGPRNLSGLVLLACALIAATTAIQLLVSGVTAKADMVSIPSAPCSYDDRGPLWPQDVRIGARKQLAPPGAVSLTICGYNGMNASLSAPQFGLVSNGGTFDRRVIDRITARLDRLKPAHGSYSCPMDQESDDVLTFEYASGPAVVVTVDTGGCGVIDNGHIKRLALGVPIAAEIAAQSVTTAAVEWPAVVGHLRLCGGPAPGRCYIENFDSADRVVVTNANGLWVAMAPVDRGRFHFRVANPASDTFALYAGNKLVKKLKRYVTFGKTTRVVFLIPIP